MLTFAEFEANANRLAHLYRTSGYARGDHVRCSWRTTSATARRWPPPSAPASTSPASTRTSRRRRSPTSSTTATPGVFITSAAKADVAVAAAALTPKVETFLCIDADRRVGPFRPVRRRHRRVPRQPIADEQLGAAMLYSSGTTGRPKGILRPLPEVHPARAAAGDGLREPGCSGMRPGMTYLSPAPIYHSAPQASIVGALRLGATSIIMERFDPEAVPAPASSGSASPTPRWCRRCSAGCSSCPPRSATGTTCRQPRGDRPRRRAVPGPGEGGDDRVVRADHHRVLRRHRGQRVHVLHERGMARPQGHRRQADPRHAADPRRRRQRGPDRDDGDGVVRRRDQLHVLPRSAQDRREPRRDGAALDGGRRRLRRRGRLPLPHRPQDVHDHLRWREHLSAGGGEPARHPPRRCSTRR